MTHDDARQPAHPGSASTPADTCPGKSQEDVLATLPSTASSAARVRRSAEHRKEFPMSTATIGDPRAPSRLLTRRALGALAAATTVTTRFGRSVAAQDATPTMPSATVHVNGIDLYYEEHGSGPPLLLIPGLSSTGFTLPALEPQFRCISVDNRGAGRSAAPPGPYTTRLLADDAAALLEHLGIARAHVLGFSLGGLIAQELALAYPERVDHLVLNGTVARPNHAVFDPWLTLFVQAYEKQIDPVAFNLWLLGWLVTPAFMSQLDLVAAALQEEDPYPASAQGVAAQADAARTHDTLDRLGQISAPTLVLVGAQDILFPVVYSQELAEGIPGATLKVLDPGGHAVLFEYADAANQALLDFLPV
jgi:3-oxoadipate enol-lactonase